MTNPFLYFALSLGLTSVAFAWSLGRRQGALRSRRWFTLMIAPGLLLLLAFYSLAFHMHSSLGGWPDFYGNEKLPRELAAHAEISQWVFGVVVLLAVVMPLLLAVFAVVPRFRRSMIYPSCCGVACWLGLLATLLAPAGFLKWWWD